MGTPFCKALCDELEKLAIYEFQRFARVSIDFSQYQITSFSCLTIMGYRPVSLKMVKLDVCNLTPSAHFEYGKCKDSKRLFGLPS